MRSDTHKVLHPIAGRPMLLHLLDRVDGLGAQKRVVVVGKGRDQVEEALNGRDVTVAHQAEQKGTAHAVQQAAQALDGYDGAVLILYGDTPFVEAETLKRMLDRLDGAGRSRRGRAGLAPGRSRSLWPRSSSAKATASPRWSSIRTRPRRSGRSACATAG